MCTHVVYQLYASDVSFGISLESPWSGVQIPAAPPNKLIHLALPVLR